MTTRHQAREAALGALFELDLGKGRIEEALEPVRAQEWPRDDWALIERLVRGTRGHADEIDALIRGVAEHWSLERMATVDRNVLRMAIFELQHTETPVGVIINEAIELAKQYSTEESGRFVNGMLGRIVRLDPRLARVADQTAP
ncbi:MAG TPA: transcription antitermination factor NusB [bacterium]|nr:transcription antitermination factor NusB [bacterium]